MVEAARRLVGVRRWHILLGNIELPKVQQLGRWLTHYGCLGMGNARSIVGWRTRRLSLGNEMHPSRSQSKQQLPVYRPKMGSCLRSSSALVNLCPLSCKADPVVVEGSIVWEGSGSTPCPAAQQQAGLGTTCFEQCSAAVMDSILSLAPAWLQVAAAIFSIFALAVSRARCSTCCAAGALAVVAQDLLAF